MIISYRFVPFSSERGGGTFYEIPDTRSTIWRKTEICRFFRSRFSSLMNSQAQNWLKHEDPTIIKGSLIKNNSKVPEFFQANETKEDAITLCAISI